LEFEELISLRVCFFLFYKREREKFEKRKNINFCLQCFVFKKRAAEGDSFFFFRIFEWESARSRDII